MEILENFQPAIRQQNFPQFFDYQSKNSNASSAATNRLILFSYMKMSVYKIAGLILFLSSCTSSSSDADATGNFETDETIVSAEATGKILMLVIQEGQSLEANQVVGYVDTIQLS